MKVLIALCVCGLSVALPAQTSMPTFTSPDGVFQFTYSSVLVDCTKKVPSKPTSSGVPKVFAGNPPALSIPDSCQSMADVCSDLGGEVSTLACFAYPKDKFRDKPVFAAAAFFAGKVEEVTTESACLQGSQNWNPDEIESANSSKSMAWNSKFSKLATTGQGVDRVDLSTGLSTTRNVMSWESKHPWRGQLTTLKLPRNLPSKTRTKFRVA
jgi:hypothetical protein